MPGTSWPRRRAWRISRIPSSAIQVLWLCLNPWGVRPGRIGSQAASGVSGSKSRTPRPLGGLKGVPGRAEDAAGVVAAALVAAVTAEEHLLPAAAMSRRARAPLAGAGGGLAGEQRGQEGRQV